MNGHRVFRWAILVLVLAGGWLVLPDRRQVDISTQDRSDSEAVTTLSSPSPQQLPESKQVGDSTPPAGSVDNERVAWSATESAASGHDVLPDYGPAVDGAVLVAVAPDLKTWDAGDLISISVPQTGRTYTPTIDRVEKVLGRNRSYVGDLLGDDMPYSFVITVGKRNTFANISTPEGRFELVGNARQAWLMPVTNLDRH
ncbi:MAG: hypothetical protein OXC11_07850, partial [Rhodospirillales bacterium]|nr:hypothetical protein [Rhodospirillales bacterium]